MTKAKPFELFSSWYSEAQGTQILEKSSVALATATATGRPMVRIVLLKHFDELGFVFYTNLTSQKGRHLLENPYAALCFHWDPLRKQVRVTGRVEKVSDTEADAYFATRPRTSRIGAWASKQSQTLENDVEFEKRIAKYTMRFGAGPIPRPPFWSGFRLIPDEIEFWEDRRFRLHERFVFRLENGEWRECKLYP